MNATKPLTFVSGALFGAVLVTSASLAEARTKAPPPPAKVNATKDLCTVIAPSGKARATPWVQGENAYIGQLELDPGAKVPLHRDPTEEYIHVLSGSGTMTVDDKRYEVSAGTTVYMPAKAAVKFENGPTSLTAIQVFAGPGPAEKYKKWAGCAGR